MLLLLQGFVLQAWLIDLLLDQVSQWMGCGFPRYLLRCLMFPCVLHRVLFVLVLTREDLPVRRVTPNQIKRRFVLLP